jgi:hypothetical protein
MSLCICFPKFTTPLLMEMKVIYCVLLSYLNYRRFSGQQVCDEPMQVQIKHLEIMNKIQNDVINIYILMSIWVTPFLSKFFMDFILSSFLLAV